MIILVIINRALKISNTKTILYGAFHEPNSNLIGPSCKTFFKLSIAIINVIIVPANAT